MKIVSLRSENVKRLSAVYIEPDGAMVIIGGQNAQGKSSVIDSLVYALGGESTFPPKPVRAGQESATITLDLGEYTVTRIIHADGKSSLKVMGYDGTRFPSPQSILNGLFNRISFDPLEFSRMKAAAQVETLKALLGLDFTEHDRKRAAQFEQRTQLGRELKTLEGQLAGMKHHPDAPRAEESMVLLTKELEKARETNSRREQWVRFRATLETAVQDQTRRIKELEKQLQAERLDLEAIQEKLTHHDSCPQPAGADESAILARMANAEQINRQVRENSARRTLSSKVFERRAACTALTVAIEEIDKAKSDALAAAKFPVPELSFNETGVLVSGMPLEQASSAEQLRVSVAMGFAMNPKLKLLLVRDGSLLDSKSLAMVADMAEKAGGQVWLERVSDGDASAIIIEDGHVRSPAS